MPPNPLAQQVIERALTQLGVPYLWGGGNADGPTGGGFDCSGLMVYAFAGIDVHVPHQTQAIWTTGATVEIIDDIWRSPYWAREFIGAVRPLPTTNPGSRPQDLSVITAGGS